MFVVLRLISLILVAAALMLLGADAVTSLENGGKITWRSLDVVWQLFDHGGNIAFHAWCSAHLPGFMNAAVNWVTGLIGWAVLGVPGVVMAFLFGRRTADA